MGIKVCCMLCLVFGLVSTAVSDTLNPKDFGLLFQGDLIFSPDHPTLAWGVTVTFTHPVINFNTSDATVVVNGSKNGTEYLLVNKPDDGRRDVNETVHIRYTASALPNTNTSVHHTTHDYTAGPGFNPTIPQIPAGTSMQSTKYDYVEVLFKSLLFYEAQRSGKLPANNRVPWRADSALGDKGLKNEDLTGGYYDAGDLIKFNYPMAHSISLLAWGHLQWPDAYARFGQDGFMRDAVKWALDYFLKCHVSEHELYVQVGDPDIDHPIWGRPENMTMARPSYKIDEQHPGSDVAGETAAAMAAGYLVFKNVDPSYANTLLTHAKQLFDFGVAFPGLWTDSLHLNTYGSNDADDEMFWAASWLYKATGEEKYRTQAMKFHAGSNAYGGASWQDKTSYATALLYNLTGDESLKRELEHYLENLLPTGSAQYTPGGLVFLSKWGSLRNAANVALIAMMAAESGINTTTYQCWAQSQIDYALGDNPHNRSYVVGVGRNPPTHYHHRPSSCPAMIAPCTFQSFNWPGPNPHSLYGGLVGGPLLDDSYGDIRSDYVQNEVAMDYNAAFQSAIAGLIQHALKNDLPTNSLSNIKDQCVYN